MIMTSDVSTKGKSADKASSKDKKKSKNDLNADNNSSHSSIYIGGSFSNLCIDADYLDSPQKESPVKANGKKYTVLDYEQTYKTRFVTIDPTANSTPKLNSLRFPELKAEDADWYVDCNESISDRIGKDIKLDKNLEKKLRQEGLLDDPKPKEVKSPQKRRSRLMSQAKSKSRENLFGDDSSGSEEEATSKKCTVKDIAELHRLLMLDPSDNSQRAKLSEGEIRKLLEAHPDLASKKLEFPFFENRTNKSIYPLSMLSALGASKALLKLCYKAFPKAMREVDDGLGCPLHYACSFQADKETVAYLVKHNRNILTLKDIEGNTPLHLAVMNNPPRDAVKFMIEKDPEIALATDDDGNTPLHLACMEGIDIEIIKELVAVNPDVCELRTKLGATPLHLAIFYESSHDLIAFLVKTRPMSLMIADDKGRLPLHLAAASEINAKTLKLLVERYPNALGVKTKSGKTPHKIAAKAGRDQALLSILAG